MRRQRFTIESYIAAGEAYHHARKRLDPGPPRLVHRHDYFELFLVVSGRARHLVNGRRETLDAGCLVFVRPDDLHAVWSDPAQDCTIENVMFRRDTGGHLASRYGDRLAGRFFWSHEPAPLLRHLTGETLASVHRAMVSLEGGERGLLRIEACLSTILALLDAPSEAPHAAMPGWLAAACERARRPETFGSGAAGLVTHTGRGHEHVCRTMRRCLGMTPTQYVNGVRLDHAATLLARDDTPIEDVARTCGFENPSHFHRLFRARHGSPPGAYRRRRQRDPLSIQ